MLDEATRLIEEKGYNVYRACELRGGKYAERVYRFSNRLNNIYSLSKSVTATVAGILCADKRISLDDRIADYLREYFPENRDERLERATIRDLLSHACGFERGILFEEDAYTHGTDDFARLALSVKTDCGPGEKTVYSNATYYLFSVIAEKATGQTLFDFLRERLFVPLGFEGYAASTCPKGHTMGATGMFLRCEDLLKIGKLYLNEGTYEGKRFFEKRFAEEASAPLFPAGQRFYGLGFWRNGADDRYFYGDGKYGQLLVIDAEHDAVFAMQSCDPALSAADFAKTIRQG